MRFSRTSLNIKSFSHLRSISIGVVTLMYLLGYQPTFAIPPIKQSVAEAQFTQKQAIEAATFGETVNLPHPGYLTTSYSHFHPGVDIATGLGMPIKPILKGTVVEVVFGFWGLGNSVTLEHEQNYRSVYGHMGRVFVKKGDPVTASSTIGEVGMTGWTSGPHTHLEVTRDGKNIDPKVILPAIPNFNDYASHTSSPSTVSTAPARIP